MNALWRKEIRQMLPVWLLALGLPLAALVLHVGVTVEVAVMFAVLGCALLGGSSFGPEFSHATMGQLLSLPVERQRVWWMKMAVLGIALTPFLAAILLVPDGPSHNFLARLLFFIPLCAFCATPWLTLRAQNGLAAAVLSIAAPVLMCSVIAMVMSWAQGNVLGEGTAAETLRFERQLITVFFWVLSSYCGATAWLSYRLFTRFQVVDNAARDVPWGDVLSVPLTEWSKRLPGGRGPIASLVRKELQLQQLVYLMAAVLVQLVAVILLSLQAIPAMYREVPLQLPVYLFAGIVPLFLGAVAVAEERNLGLHAWQLTLPVPAWKQWLIKVLMTLAASSLLGVLLPWACLAAAHRLDPGTFSDVWPKEVFPVMMTLLAQAVVTLVALFASSFSSNTLKALLNAVGLLVGMGFLIGLLGNTMENSTHFQKLASLPVFRPPHPWLDSMDLGALILISTFLLTIATLLIYSFHNFHQTVFAWRRLCLQVCVLLVAPSVLVIVTMVVIIGMTILVHMIKA